MKVTDNILRYKLELITTIIFIINDSAGWVSTISPRDLKLPQVCLVPASLQFLFICEASNIAESNKRIKFAFLKYTFCIIFLHGKKT